MLQKNLSDADNNETCDANNHGTSIRRAVEEIMARGQDLNKQSILETLITHGVHRCSINEIEKWAEINLEWFYIQSMLDQPQWEEIALHGPQCGQFISQSKITAFEIGPWDKDDYQLALEILAYQHGMAWSRGRPFVSFQLTIKGITLRATLVHAVIMPMQTSKLFLRCAPRFQAKINQFAFDQKVGNLIEELVMQKENIVIAGPTGSGKTTLLRAMLALIPSHEHIVTVEDTQEFSIDSPFKTAMVSHGDSIQMRNFLAWSMRISPKRIILGEIRSEEIVPFFLALNTGHRGLLATVHANSAREVPERLALLYGLYQGQATTPWKNLMQMLCRGIQWIVYVEHKNITQIIKLNGSDGNVPFFEEIYPFRQGE